MSADIYADNARQIQAKIGEQASSRLSDIDDMTNNVTNSFNTTLAGYTSKWSEVQQLGTAGVGTPLALRGVRAAYNKFKSVKASGDARNAARAKQQAGTDGGEPDATDTSATQDGGNGGDSGGAEGNDGGTGAEGGGSSGGDGGSSGGDGGSSGGSDGPQAVDTEVDNLGGDSMVDDADLVESSNNYLSQGLSKIGGYARDAYQAIGQKGQAIKGLFGSGTKSAAQTGADAGADAATTLADGSAELTAFTTGDLALGAVPVVGEFALAAGGLVALGEGIYHLFEKPSAPKAPANLPPCLLYTSPSPRD